MQSPQTSAGPAELSAEALAAALGASPAAHAVGQALIAIGGEPVRLVAVSPEAPRFFGVADPAALERALLDGDGPTARRLAHLAATLPPGAPRLEALPARRRGRRIALNLLCLRVAGPAGEPLLILSSPPRDGTKAATLATTATTVCAAPESARDLGSPAPGPILVGASERSAARFLWRLDAERRFGAPHAALIEALGAAAPRAGETLVAFAARHGLDPEGEFARAVEAGLTFTGLATQWPRETPIGARTLLLSGAPQFDRERRFAGFLGFGLIGAPVADWRPARPPAPPERSAAAASAALPSWPTEVEPSPADRAAPAPEASATDEAAAAPEDAHLAVRDAHAPSDPAPARETAAESAPVSPAASGEEEAADDGDPRPFADAPSPEFPVEAEADWDGALAEFVADPGADVDEDSEPQTSPSSEADPFAALEAAVAATRAQAEKQTRASVREAASRARAQALSSGMIAALAAWSEAGARSNGLAAGESPDAAAPADLGAPSPQSGAASEPTGAASTPPRPGERSAEIHVLRPAPPANVVPIRPGALEVLTPREALEGEGAGDDSVELSASEKEAFKEIARALGGRHAREREELPAPSFEGEVANPVAAARDALGHAFGPAAPASPAPAATSEPAPAPAAPAADAGAARNAAAVLDRLPIGALVTREGEALYLNRTLLDLLGYRDLAHFRAADGLATMFRDRDPASFAPPHERGALPLVRADGERLAVEGHAQPIAWDGAPATLIALRRALEEELQHKLRDDAASDLSLVLDRATDGAALLDSAGRILSLTRSGEGLFGYEPKEVVGDSVLMLLAPASHPETTRRLERLSRAGEGETAGETLEVVGRTRGGEARPLAMTLGRVGPQDAPRYCAAFRDLSRQHEAERRLTVARDAAQAANLAKTDFLAKVSHEIRTPLNAILGFAEVMIEERFGPIGNERYKDYLKDIHASGRHVMSLADDLLDLTKIEAGKLDLSFVPVDANGLIRECVALMQPQAARERIIMRVSLSERLPRILADERSLKQIMLNLMSNAVKFNEPGGQVIVSTAVDAAGQAVIRVRDTGVGMNESDIGVALTPFGRVAGSKAGGAGLGLPLTKALVEANKAEFSIKSRREQGTLIELAFPNVQAAQ